MTTFERILVPTDFSEHSLNATRVALDIAQRYGGKVTLVHVDDPVAYAFPDGYPAPANAREAIRKEVQQQLAVAQAEAALVHPGVETQVLEGPTAIAICDFARNRFDLIVMGTHGRTGVARLLLGSVAEQVVRLAPCPVLTIRPPERAKAA